MVLFIVFSGLRCVYLAFKVIESGGNCMLMNRFSVLPFLSRLPRNKVLAYGIDERLMLLKLVVVLL